MFLTINLFSSCYEKMVSSFTTQGEMS